MGRQDKMLRDVQQLSVQSLLERGIFDATDADSDEVKGYKKEVISAVVIINANFDLINFNYFLQQHSNLLYKIKFLEESNTAHLDRDKISSLKKRLIELSETIKKKISRSLKSEHERTKELINSASVVCATLSSSVNIIQ